MLNGYLSKKLPVPLFRTFQMEHLEHLSANAREIPPIVGMTALIVQIKKPL